MAGALDLALTIWAEQPGLSPSSTVMDAFLRVLKWIQVRV